MAYNHNDASARPVTGRTRHTGSGGQMKRELLSPAYTTRWADIPAAKLT
ncbi:DUF4113 domain-containing protein [Salmonella enterica]|nr:DUF4113 domain-containing protein [Salmonella enterica]